MKKIYHIFIALIFFLPAVMVCQQSFFDVPTSDTIGKKRIFFQEQININEEELVSGTALTWGLPKGFEVGLGLQQLTLNVENRRPAYFDEPEDESVRPDLLLTAQKIFNPLYWYAFSFGTKTGLSQADDAGLKVSTFSYFNNQLVMPFTQNKLTFGVYYANEPYAGSGAGFGLMSGVQIDFVKDKVFGTADFFSGASSISKLNAGLGYNLNKKWEISAGYSWPLPENQDIPSLIIQLQKK